MKIVCDSCGSKYSIADDKVRGKVFKIRCKECDDVIVVQGDEQEDDTQQTGYDDEGYGSADAAAEWYAVIDGDQVGPITAEEIEAYFQDNVLEMSSYVWREGLDDWTKIEEMDEFNHLGGDFAGPDERTQVSEGLAAGDHTQEVDDGGEAETVVTEPGEFSGMFDDDQESQQQPAADEGAQAGQQEAATQEVSRSEHFGQAGLDAGDAGQQQAQQAQQGGQQGEEDLFSDFDEAAQNPGSAESTREVASDEQQQLQQGQRNAQQGGAQQGAGADFESFGGGGQQGGGAQSGTAQSGAAATSGQAMSGGGSGRSQSGHSGTGAGGGTTGAGGGARRGDQKVGERSENSVLFSLDSVDEMQAVDESESGEDVSGAGATTEGSGLIDIQNLAASHAAMKGDDEQQGGGGGAAASGGPAAGASGGQQKLSTQSMQSVPNLNPKGSRQNNTVLIAAIVAGSLVLLGALGVVGYIVMTRQSQPKKVVKKEQSASGAQAAQTGAASDQQAAGDNKGNSKNSKQAAAGGDAGGAVAKASGDAGVAKTDAGKDKKKADKKEDDRKKVASNDPDPEPDRHGGHASDEPDRPTGGTGGGGGGGGGGSDEEGDDIDNLLDNVGDKKKEGGGSGGGGEAKKNLPKKPTKSDVLSTIRGFSGRISSCASNQNKQDLSGTMKVRFQIEPSGRVSTTNIQTGKFQGTDVGSCVTGVVKNMKFVETQNGMPVVFPFSIE